MLAVQPVVMPPHGSALAVWPEGDGWGLEPVQRCHSLNGAKVRLHCFVVRGTQHWWPALAPVVRDVGLGGRLRSMLWP